ncbi:MAG TPA: AraC family transcriptional regulator [Sphingomicrobium sp.]
MLNQSYNYRDRSNLSADPLSEILGLLRPSSFGFRGLDARGDWMLVFRSAPGLKCYAVTTGSCWLGVEGARPVRIEAGDLALLAGDQEFRLFTSSDADPIDAYEFFLAIPPGEAAVLNGGGSVSGVGGFFEFESDEGGALLSVLPPLIHIAAFATNGELMWPITRLMRELRSPQPGGALLAQHLAQALLIDALRLHLADANERRSGWLYALGEPRLRTVLAAMHAEPARKWKLVDFAQLAGMSRTSFATRFSAVLGEPAIGYLTRWRMLLAADFLRNQGQSIATVAHAVGYESESAFGAAFRRAWGRSPRGYVQRGQDKPLGQ